jgi:hypothetical protein
MSAFILLRGTSSLVNIIICRILTESNLYRNGLIVVHFRTKDATPLHWNANTVTTMT